MTSVNKAWGDLAEWSGFVSSGKRNGSPVYADVPRIPLHMSDTFGSVPGLQPDGPARLIGFLQQVGRNWSVVSEFRYPQQNIIESVQDGRLISEPIQ